jgi:hypothetical protein
LNSAVSCSQKTLLMADLSVCSGYRNRCRSRTGHLAWSNCRGRGKTLPARGVGAYRNCTAG